MTEAPGNILRSILAIVAGIAVGVVLSLVTDMAMRSAGVSRAAGPTAADSLWRWLLLIAPFTASSAAM